MLSRPAENSFRRGIASLNTGDKLAALAYFEAAIRLDRERNPHRPSMLYQSYFGLCMAFATDHRRKALEICQQAADSEFFNPDIHWNLGRVLLIQGDKRRAVHAFRRGLELDGGHAGLRFQVRRLGARRRPVLGFLNRSHPLNRLAGRLRAQLSD